MSKSPSSDPRVRRSRRWLQDALKALVQERDYESITVLDLAARADVNRTTFYQHFGDKDELLDSIVDDLLETLNRETETYLATVDEFYVDEVPPFVLHLYEQIGREAGFYRRMLGPGGSPRLFNNMVQTMERGLMGHVAAGFAFNLPLGVPPTLTARFLALGVIGSLSWWLEQEPLPSASDAAGWGWRLAALVAETPPASLHKR